MPGILLVGDDEGDSGGERSEDEGDGEDPVSARASIPPIRLYRGPPFVSMMSSSCRGANHRWAMNVGMTALATTTPTRIEYWTWLI
ncbi:MAG: hypothetical protein MZV63_40280 [Marinilabiliales bacterium]|nr:hypothetical protein [Marinilabiliales bacterium]